MSESLNEVLDKLWQQFADDRKEVDEIYKDLKALIKGSTLGYEINGDTLAKYAELRIKNTAQILELIKVLKKDDKGGDTLTPSELNQINEELKKGKKKEEDGKS